MADVQIRGADGAAPQTYAVPNATEIIPRAINATFNGAGTAATWVPVVEIISDGGVVIARCPCSTSVAAGGSAECSFYPFNDEPASATPSGQTLDEVIFSLSPWSWWKLDESAGSTAFDSTTFRQDMSTPGGSSDPTWGQAAGPPGTQTAFFGSGANQVVNRPAFADLTGDFTMCGWINRSTNLTSYLLTQGSPFSAHTGVAIGIFAFNQGAGDRAFVAWGGGGTVRTIEGDNALATGTWYFVAAVRESGTFTLYVDGAAQTTTSALSYTSFAGINAAKDILQPLANDVTLSYLMTFTYALSAAEVAAIYLAA